MTELFSDGFENGNFSQWTGTSTPSPTVVEEPHCGTYGILRDDDAERCYKYLPSSYSVLHVRVYWKLSFLPNTGNYSIVFRAYNTATKMVNVEYWNDAGTYKWRLFLSESGESDTYTQTVDVDTWYCVEFRYDATSNLHKLWVDGAEVISFSATVTQSMERISIGYNSARWWAHNEYVDCVEVADTYIGPESTEQTYTKNWTTDTLFKKLGIPKTFDVNTALQKQGIQKNFGVDAGFLKSGVPKSFILDAFLKSLDITESFAVDACFGALSTQTVSRQIDVLLKKLGATQSFGLDSFFGAVSSQSYVKTVGLDVVFAYKVRLPELWLDQNGKLVLNSSKPYAWVGT